MGISLWVATEVRDRNGKVIHRTRKRKSHSYVQGWNWVLCAQFLGSSNPDPALGPVPDIGGTNRNLRTSGAPFRCNAGIGTPNPGIRIGTSTVAVAIDQYALQAPIAQGTGAGQMEYQAMSYNWIGVVGTVCSFEAERVVVNNSGATIYVREAGLYMTAYQYPTAGITMCAARDLISEDVPSGGSVTVTYTIRIVL